MSVFGADLTVLGDLLAFTVDRQFKDPGLGLA